MSGLNLPLTLAAGQSTSFKVVFAPQTGTSVTGNIAIASNASNSTLNVSLSGAGVTPGSLSASSSSLSLRQRAIEQQSEPAGNSHQLRRVDCHREPGECFWIRL